MTVPRNAGNSSEWGAWVPLRTPPGDSLLLDLSALEFADPLFLLRLRGFIDWHAAEGRAVRIVPPTSTNVRNYLARMHLADDLPARCECDLGSVRGQDQSHVLIPIRRLGSNLDSDALDYELDALYAAHFTGRLGGLADAFTRTVGEMCDNATTHGVSPLGAYVAAQRYAQTRAVLAVGDLGVGVPEHIRRALPHLTDDGEALAEATKEGVTATGNPHRGIGYQYVIDGIIESGIPRGELRVWAGRGQFRVDVRRGRETAREAWTVERPTVGTWVRLELST